MILKKIGILYPLKFFPSSLEIFEQMTFRGQLIFRGNTVILNNRKIIFSVKNFYAIQGTFLNHRFEMIKER